MQALLLKLIRKIGFQALTGAAGVDMTAANAVWNAAISAGVPTLTRTWLGQTGQVRPMKTLCACMAAITSLPGRPVSIMKQFETDGMNLYPLLSSHLNVEMRVSAIIFRRVGTNSGSERLA